ncbi:MAG: carboxylating nicotinate-nucleotide diphosphorylase [Thermoplasmata archaeon]
MKNWVLDRELERFLNEDIGYGDITTQLFDPGRDASGIIVAKEDFVVSGLEEAARVFEKTGCITKVLFDAGDDVDEGDTLMEISGSASSILTGERLALNIIMRMSGIATKTKSMVERGKGLKVAATRKTTPGFRYFEKKAVEEGGGDPHRFRLDDMVLIKDNHIRLAGGIESAVKKGRKASFSKKIDVEVETFEQAKEAAEMGVDIIMLDNMEPEEARKSYEQIKSIDEDIIVEVSGGIDESNIADYIGCCDVVSSGALTHSTSSVDVSLDLKI